MEVHPSISISFGVIISFILYFIAVPVFGVMGWVGAFQAIQGASWLGTFLLIIAYALGGYLAIIVAKHLTHNQKCSGGKS